MAEIAAQRAARAYALEAEKRQHAHENALDEQRLAEARREAATDALVKAHREYQRQLAV